MSALLDQGGTLKAYVDELTAMLDTVAAGGDQGASIGRLLSLRNQIASRVRPADASADAWLVTSAWPGCRPPCVMAARGAHQLDHATRWVVPGGSHRVRECW